MKKLKLTENEVFVLLKFIMVSEQVMAAYASVEGVSPYMVEYMNDCCDSIKTIKDMLKKL